MAEIQKIFPTIGCCGIDCGLCPRFYTKGDSQCPGCGGDNFYGKHPACGLLTCCTAKKGLEVCSECNDYPCSRFESEKEEYDSFVTHKKIFENLDYIKSKGIEQFIENQRFRIETLNNLLLNYDEGRSKGFYCISCALLPLHKLNEINEFAQNMSQDLDLKEESKSLKVFITSIADSLDIDLKLRKRN